MGDFQLGESVGDVLDVGHDVRSDIASPIASEPTLGVSKKAHFAKLAISTRDG